ncbi:MAG TPA: hypothetical protein VMF87_16860 [Streptosporangiaceae bacterium]|nr:hypothetical protein [Streptosporangiaceae bacterium]
MMRAQLAATELERAWDRWRTLHGLATGPLPPVSSYVGYSTDEPWGQPRVVFGMDAAEAEQFAALLDRHDCAPPVYAAMTTKSGTRQEQEADAQPADPGRARVRVPAQAQLAAVPRESTPEPSPADPLFGPLQLQEAAARGAADAEAGSRETDPEPEPPARGAQGRDAAESGLPSFRPRREPGAYPEDDAEQAPAADEAAEPAEVGRGSGGWSRRLPGGHSLPRQKRAGGAGKGAGSKPEGKDRAGLADLAAELSGWAAGELPGEASHRRRSRPDRPSLG